MTIAIAVRNGAVIHCLTQSLQHGLANIANIPGLVARIKEESMFREFTVKSTGEHASYSSFDDFVRAPIPRGCDTTPEIIQAMERLALSMITSPGPDCGTGVGQPHRKACDVERRSECGSQRLQYAYEGHDPAKAAWTGEWPNAASKRHDYVSEIVRRLGGKYLRCGINFVFKLVGEDEFLRRATYFPFPVRVIGGVPKMCHANVGQSTLTNAVQVSGFALWGNDWHAHSWLYVDETILETTLEYEKYFGMVLTDKERRRFKKLAGIPCDRLNQ